MRNFIEIKFKDIKITRDKFVVEGSDSFLRLCDGDSDFISDNTWYSGIITKENDFIVNYNIDNSNTFNLQSPTDFTIEILDNNLYKFLKVNNVSFDNIEITYLKDLNDLRTIFTGILTNLNLSSNKLKFTATCVIKNLGIVGETLFYGNIKKEKLSIDTINSKTKLKFTDINSKTREYPKLEEYHATDITGLPRYNQGIFLKPLPNNPMVDKRTAIVIKYYNNINFEIGSRVKFVQTYNTSNKDEIRYIKDFTIINKNGYYNAIIYFDDLNPLTYNTLPSFDLSHMDQIEFYNDKKYFEIPNNPNTSNLKAYTKIDNNFVNINYDIETINNKTYIVISPYLNIYSEIPIDEIIHKSDDSIISLYDEHYNTSALTSKDMSDFYAWTNLTRQNRTEEFLIKSSALSTSNIKNLYFGMRSNIPSQLFDISMYFSLKSNDGKYFPSNNLGTIPLKDNTLNNYYKNGWGEGSKDINYYAYHGLPYFGNMISGDPGTVSDFFNNINLDDDYKQYYQSYTNREYYLSAFNSDELYKFPDNYIGFFKNTFEISLKLYYNQKNAFGYSNDLWPYIINKMMLISIDSFDTENLTEIYIDYYDPNLPKDIARIKNDLLTRSGNIVEPDYSSINTKLLVKSNEKYSDALTRLSKQGINITTYNNGEFISDSFGPENTLINSIKILEYNTNNQQKIKYPKLIFKNYLGESCYLSLYNFSGKYPVTTEELINHIKDFWEFSGFDYLFYNTIDSISLLQSLNYYILYPIYLMCKNITSIQNIDIEIDTFYVEQIYSSVNIGYLLEKLQIIKEIVYMYIKEKEYVKIETYDKNIYVGRSVIFSDPLFFQGAEIFGVVQEVTYDTLNLVNTVNILIKNITLNSSEQISIYDQGAGSYDKYIDQGLSNNLILKDK